MKENVIGLVKKKNKQKRKEEKGWTGTIKTARWESPVQVLKMMTSLFH